MDEEADGMEAILAEMEDLSPPSTPKKGRKKKEKKILNPLDPNDFIDWARTQGVVREFPKVEADSLNTKQRQIYDFMVAGLQSGICRRLLAMGPAGTGELEICFQTLILFLLSNFLFMQTRKELYCPSSEGILHLSIHSI